MASPAVATTVLTRESVADTEIDLQSPNQNKGSITTMTAKSHFQGGSGRNIRALQQFSLAGIPAGSAIVSATLELYMATASAVSRTYSVHQILTSWTEGGATWNNAGTTPWTTPGGDFGPAPLATAESGTANGVWLTWNVTATVQAWFASPSTNLGVLVKDVLEDSTTQYRADFATRENAGLDYNFNPARALRPRLSITYDPPALQITSFTVDPSVFSTDTVTVRMTVTNNGATALAGVAPSSPLGFSGTATPALVSGPSPASVASLAPAASATFTWTYTMTGSQDQTYLFTGSASDGSAIVTAPAAETNAGTPGRISIYTVSVTPVEVQSVGTNVQVTFRVTNGLTTGTIDWLNIVDPATGIWRFSDPAWQANDTSGWSKTVQQGVSFRFVSPGAGQDIPPDTGTGDNYRDFTITFDTVADPGIDTVYNFDVTVRQRGKVQDILVQTSITVRIPTLEVTAMTVDATAASGGNVTIVMTVRNRGSSTLTDVTPSSTLTPAGTAGTSYASGPTPPSVPALAGGASTSFEWVYTVTGSVDQTYAFSGTVQANGGGLTAGPTVSNTGRIASYGLTVAPTSVTAGSAAVQIRFTVQNTLAAGTVDRITVTNPNTTFWVTDATWASNNSGTSSSTWTSSQPTASAYRYTSPGVASDIAASGATKDFIVTFATVGDPGLDTTYTFGVAVHRRGDQSGNESTVTGTVLVTRYVLELISVTSSLPADGATTSTIRVRLTRTGAGQGSETLTYATTGGTFPGPLTTATTVTDASGYAELALTPPVSKSGSSGTVTVSFASVVSVSTTITFTGIAVNPVGYLAATAESGQVTLYWSTPVSPQYSDSVIALRNPTSVPTETLTDFTSYGNGATVGSSTVIKVLDTDGASVVDGGLTNGLKYYYKIFNAYKDLYSETSNLSIDSTPTPGTGGTPAWTYSLAGAGASLGIPLTQGSRVIAARGNRLFALDRATGAQDWITSPLGGSVEGWLVPWPKSGTYSDVLGDWTAYTLYAGATDGKAYAFDTSGNQVWASGVLGDGIQATVSPQSWDLEFLNPDFQLTYTDGAGGPMDVVFVATRNGSTTNNTVSALRGFAASGGTPDGGTSIWTFDPQNLVPPAPMDIVVAAPQPTSAPHNLVIVGSYSAGQTQPSLWAINGVTGVNGPAGALVASKGVLGNGPPAHLGDITSEVTFGYACWDCWEVNTIYAGTASGYVVALNLPDLTEKWAANFDAGSPIVGYIWEDLYDPGTLYFTTQDGYVRAIRDNGASATELWRTATAIPSASSPVVDEDRGTLWVGGSGGRLVEIDTASGAMTTAFPGEAAETLGDPTVDFVGGRVYVGSSAGRLHAVPIPLP